LDNLKDDVDIDRTWENVGDIKTSAKEYATYCKPKEHKLWFGEGRLKLLDQRNQYI
jgi:DNA-binding protein H-NS